MTLDWGRIWQVSADGEVQVLTDFTDVSALFGWSYDGSKLLFGRGREEVGEYGGFASELWISNRLTGHISQLTHSNKVISASWSPMDNRVAYCEFDSVLKIVGLNGDLLFQRKDTICEFTWAPDGSAIAIEFFTPELFLSDGSVFTALGIWWLAEGELQTINLAWNESHSSPTWSIAGNRLVFERILYGGNTETVELTGIYIAEVSTGKINHLEGTSLTSTGIYRSPTADMVVFQKNNEIYIMDFIGNAKFIAEGQLIQWLPDGKSLLYRPEDKEELQVHDLTLELNNVPKSDVFVYGGQISVTTHRQPEYIFTLAD